MSNAFDVVVIGAGIAGATAAAHLSATHRVALVEAEDAAGYHTTGRSAALWILNYGPPDVRVLTANRHSRSRPRCSRSDRRVASQAIGSAAATVSTPPASANSAV